MDQTHPQKPAQDRWAEIGGRMEKPKMKTNGGRAGRRKEAKNRKTQELTFKVKPRLPEGAAEA